MTRPSVELSLVTFLLAFLIAYTAIAQEEAPPTAAEGGAVEEAAEAEGETDEATDGLARGGGEAQPTEEDADPEGPAPQPSAVTTEEADPAAPPTREVSQADAGEPDTGGTSGETEEASALGAAEPRPDHQAPPPHSEDAEPSAARPQEGPHHHPEDSNCHGRRFFEDLEETDHPFALRRGRVDIGLVGTIQLLAVPFIQNPMASIEAGSIASAEGFRLRRSRFGFAGSLPHDFDVRLLFELGEGGANILDASVAWEPHELARITAGALKVPFSGIMMLSAEYQSFLQRPYAVRTIAPDRALGVEISGQNHYFSYHAGVFNGGGDYYRGDNNAGMLYAARVAAHILGPPPAGEISQPDSFVFQVAGSYFFNQDATGNRQAASAELLLRWRRLSFRGEFLWDTFAPASDPESDEGIEYGSTERLGWFTEAGVFIINDHLQVALRYEAQRINEANFDFNDMHDLWTISGAVHGYFLQGRIKLSLQYEHRQEWNDPQLDNDFLALQLQGRI